MLWKELVYIVNDICKLYSDDSSLTEDHIIFMLSTHRAYILKSTYSNGFRTIPESNYQTVCLTMEPKTSDVCSDMYESVSKEEVPNMMGIGLKIIYPSAGLQYGNIVTVDPGRYKYVGSNSYLRNSIFAMFSFDGKLYMKSAYVGVKYLDSVKVMAIFESPEKAASLSCKGGDGNKVCDVLDSDEQFPIEDALIPMLVQSVVKDILGAAYRPSDKTNDANDELDDIAKMIASYAKKNFNDSVRANDQ